MQHLKKSTPGKQTPTYSDHIINIFLKLSAHNEHYAISVTFDTMTYIFVAVKHLREYVFFTLSDLHLAFCLYDYLWEYG